MNVYVIVEQRNSPPVLIGPFDTDVAAAEFSTSDPFLRWCSWEREQHGSACTISVDEPIHPHAFARTVLRGHCDTEGAMTPTRS